MTNIVEQLKIEMGEIQVKINKIQEACSHPEGAVTKRHGSNTGNYDPGADEYWTDFHCELCLKYWTKEGSL